MPGGAAVATSTPEVELVEVADDALLPAYQLAGVRAEVQVGGAALHDGGRTR